jgi:hypothetical protein
MDELKFKLLKYLNEDCQRSSCDRKGVFSYMSVNGIRPLLQLFANTHKLDVLLVGSLNCGLDAFGKDIKTISVFIIDSLVLKVEEKSASKILVSIDVTFVRSPNGNHLACAKDALIKSTKNFVDLKLRELQGCLLLNNDAYPNFVECNNIDAGISTEAVSTINEIHFTSVSDLL